MAIAHIYDQASAPAVFRTRKQVAGFFGDFPLVEPGLVQVGAWRNGAHYPRSPLQFIGGVARKS